MCIAGTGRVFLFCSDPEKSLTKKKNQLAQLSMDYSSGRAHRCYKLIMVFVV